MRRSEHDAHAALDARKRPAATIGADALAARQPLRSRLAVAPSRASKWADVFAFAATVAVLVGPFLYLSTH